jgi:hypothetical protein
MEENQMHNQKRIVMSVVILALLLVSAVLLPLVKANASVKDTAVVVKLTLPGGKWIEARVIEDGFLKIHDEQTGRTTGFSMQVLNKATGTVRVKALDFSNGNENSFRELESLDVSFKSSKTTSVMDGTTIEVLAVVEQIPEKSSADAGKGSGEVASLRPPECCVTCDGLKVCSNCRVTMSCGSCNTERCPD